MNRKNLILSGLAVVQAFIIAFVFWLTFKPETLTVTKLITVPKENINSIVITDNNSNSLTLSKLNDAWVLTEADNFIANEFQIDNLLSTLLNLGSQGIISRNASSYERLGISENNFTRKIELINSSGKDETLYIGSAPRPSAVHVRSSNSAEVYLTSDIRSTEANATASSWIDTSYLSFDPNDVIELNIENQSGSYNFIKENNRWQMQSLNPDESFNESSVTELLARLSRLTMLEPLNLASNNSHGTDTPLASITLKTLSEKQNDPQELNSSSDSIEESSTDDSEELEYEEQLYSLAIGSQLDSGYAVKASTSDYVVKVSAASLEALLNNDKNAFLEQEENP